MSGVKLFLLLTSHSPRGRWFVLIRCNSNQIAWGGGEQGRSLASSAECQVTAAAPTAETMPRVTGLTSEHHRGHPAGSCRPKMLSLIIGHCHRECMACPPSIRMPTLWEISQDIKIATC